MDKIAAYEILLAEHPLWKEAGMMDDGSRAKAVRNSLIGSTITQVGHIPGGGTLGSAIGAQEGRRLRSAAGHIVGGLGGAMGGGMLGGAIGGTGGNRIGSAIGHLTGGAYGTYLGHGKDLTKKQLQERRDLKKRLKGL